MTMFGLWRITTSSTHFSGVPRQHLEGKNKWLRDRRSPPALHWSRHTSSRLWGAYMLGAFTSPSEKRSILVSWAFVPVLWLWTWHFTLSRFPNPNPQARGITQHSTSQPWHDWHCGLDHSFRWDHQCTPGHLPVSPASTHRKPGASASPAATTQNLSKHCQISLFIAQSPWVENHLTEYKTIKKTFKILFQGDQLNKAWCIHPVKFTQHIKSAL